MARNESEIIIPKEIFDNISKICCSMIKGKQEDAQEFLINCIEKLEQSYLEPYKRMNNNKNLNEKIVNTNIFNRGY